MDTHKNNLPDDGLSAVTTEVAVDHWIPTDLTRVAGTATLRNSDTAGVVTTIMTRTGAGTRATGVGAVRIVGLPMALTGSEWPK
jgi:hypothetical protein